MLNMYKALLLDERLRIVFNQKKKKKETKQKGGKR